MKYEIEIIAAYRHDKRISTNRDCAIRIFKSELRQANYIRDNNVRGYLYKLYKNGSRCIIYHFDTYYSKELKRYF